MALSTQVRLHSLSVLQSTIVLCRFLWKDIKRKNRTFVRVWIDHVMHQSMSRPPGFKIYFYVQLPLGQPQDLVWLPIEYFGCPSSCPSSSQETNTGS